MRISDPRAAPSGEEGFALIVVIGFLLVVTAIILPFTLAARTAIDAGAADLVAVRSRMAAEGLALAVATDLADGAAEDRAAFPRGGTCRAGDVRVQLRVEDQRGLVDLNAASETLIEGGLRAVGLGGADAARHARAIAAYRIAPDADRPLPAATVALMRAGPKGAPFEAVEELYDFPALAGVPQGTLLATFTVHSRRTRLIGSAMPDHLAAYIPRRPTPGLDEVVEAPAGGAEDAAGPYRIDVFVRTPDGTVGRTGAVVAVAGGSVTVLERLWPAALPVTPAGPAFGDCAALFGPAARILRDLSA